MCDQCAVVVTLFCSPRRAKRKLVFLFFKEWFYSSISFTTLPTTEYHFTVVVVGGGRPCMFMFVNLFCRGLDRDFPFSLTRDENKKWCILLRASIHTRREKETYHQEGDEDTMRNSKVGFSLKIQPTISIHPIHCFVCCRIDDVAGGRACYWYCFCRFTL